MLCQQTDRSVAREICETIVVRSERKDWQRRCKMSSLKLIPMLFERCLSLGPTADTAVSIKMAQMVEKGPGARTISAWNEWRNEFDMWNKTQSKEARLKRGLLASRYAAAIRTRRCRPTRRTTPSSRLPPTRPLGAGCHRT